MTQHHHISSTWITLLPLEAQGPKATVFEQDSRVFELIASSTSPKATALSRWPLLASSIDQSYAIKLDAVLTGRVRDTCKYSPALEAKQYLSIRCGAYLQWMPCAYLELKFRYSRIQTERNSSGTAASDNDQASDAGNIAPLAQLSGNACGKASRPLSHGHLEAEEISLNIIGGLLTLMLGRSPGGKRYSEFCSLGAVINALIIYHGHRAGMSEQTLRARFAQARRQLSSTQ